MLQKHQLYNKLNKGFYVLSVKITLDLFNLVLYT